MKDQRVDMSGWFHGVTCILSYVFAITFLVATAIVVSYVWASPCS